MDTTAPELSRDLARLMLMMRRMIKEEFAVTVPLSDDEAAEELLAFAGRSRNTLLRQMAHELERQLHARGPGNEKPVMATSRGAAVSQPAQDAAATVARHRRVYRGNVID
ncbi:MAG: hypothetical protein AB7U81_08660 [Thiohalomonadaceae bacterium]